MGLGPLSAERNPLKSRYFPEIWRKKATGNVFPVALFGLTAKCRRHQPSLSFGRVQNFLC